MKAAVCYEIVMLVEHTLNIIQNPQKLWSVFTSNGTNLGGAHQYSFKFNFPPRIKTTLMYIYILSEFTSTHYNTCKVFNAT